MVKLLVAYGSKHGSTREVAEVIADKLGEAAARSSSAAPQTSMI
jgi:flavodoxin